MEFQQEKLKRNIQRLLIQDIRGKRQVIKMNKANEDKIKLSARQGVMMTTVAIYYYFLTISLQK